MSGGTLYMGSARAAARRLSPTEIMRGLGLMSAHPSGTTTAAGELRPRAASRKNITTDTTALKEAILLRTGTALIPSTIARDRGKVMTVITATVRWTELLRIPPRGAVAVKEPAPIAAPAAVAGVAETKN